MADMSEKVAVPGLRWRLLVACAVAASVLALDRFSKAAVHAALAHGSFRIEVVPGVLEFRFVANTGAAFSFGEGFGWAFALLAVAVVMGSACYLVRGRSVSRLEVVGLAMLAGGAIGNAVDRMLLGYVTDFIAVRFVDFPVFNVADIGITCGVALALIGFLFPSPAGGADEVGEVDRRDDSGVPPEMEGR